MSIDDQIRSLSPNEKVVLKLKCQGLKYGVIAERLGYSVEWVQLQMSTAYKKLGFSKEMHHIQRKKILDEQVCPKLEGVQEKVEDVVESEPVPDPEILPIVLYDDNTGIAPPPPPPRRFPLIPVVGVILAVCLVAICGGLSFGRRLVFASTSTPTATLTRTLIPTRTQIPTETLTLTPTLSPTDTLTPTQTETFTPIPTDTKPPTGLTVGDELRDNRVTMKLKEVLYNQGYDAVGSRIAPISYLFDFTNHSGGTLLIQFDTSNFVIEDNTGRTAECWFFVSPFQAFEDWSSNLNDGDTMLITARCGLDQVPQDVITYTLTILPFTSLPESTWVVEVPR